jgi:hypothetical protein
MRVEAIASPCNPKVTPFSLNGVTTCYCLIIRNSRPSERPRKLTDNRGLFPLLMPNGSRWWRFKYQFSGKENLLSVGVYPDVSLKATREKADSARRLIAAGNDPSVVRQAEKRST